MTASISASNQWDDISPQDMLEMLRYQADIGADEALLDTPAPVSPTLISPAPAGEEIKPPTAAPSSDQRPPADPAPRQTPFMPPPVQQPISPDVDWGNFSTLDELKAAVAAWSGADLKKTASHLVFGDGNSNADVMFIGHSPGADEDRQGKPFIGVSGQLLNRMLASIGLDRQAVYLTNILLWRPPGNRTPTPEEINQFMPILRRHIELVQPKIIVALGEVAGKSLLATQETILKQRGKWVDDQYVGQSVAVMATLHPDQLCKTPGQKALAWQDLCQLSEKISELGLR